MTGVQSVLFRSGRVWPQLKLVLQKLQVPFPEYMDEALVKANTGRGHCYQAHEAIKPLCEQLLKVEKCYFGGVYDNGPHGSFGLDSQGSRKNLSYPPCLFATGTSLTQTTPFNRLVELCKENGKPIHVAIRYF